MENCFYLGIIIIIIIITVLYMEMTYREPQTPLFPPSYVNFVNKKDH